jgi:hypothetical protein
VQTYSPRTGLRKEGCRGWDNKIPDDKRPNKKSFKNKGQGNSKLYKAKQRYIPSPDSEFWKIIYNYCRIIGATGKPTV